LILARVLVLDHSGAAQFCFVKKKNLRSFVSHSRVLTVMSRWLPCLQQLHVLRL
jgi:hypothetical protein